VKIESEEKSHLAVHICILRMLVLLFFPYRYYKVGSVPSPAAIGNVQNVMGVLFSGANFLGNINLM
jgi:predicted transporter